MTNSSLSWFLDYTTTTWIDFGLLLLNGYQENKNEKTNKQKQKKKPNNSSHFHWLLRRQEPFSFLYQTLQSNFSDSVPSTV